LRVAATLGVKRTTSVHGAACGTARPGVQPLLASSAKSAAAAPSSVTDCSVSGAALLLVTIAEAVTDEPTAASKPSEAVDDVSGGLTEMVVSVKPLGCCGSVAVAVSRTTKSPCASTTRAAEVFDVGFAIAFVLPAGLLVIVQA